MWRERLSSIKESFWSFFFLCEEEWEGDTHKYMRGMNGAQDCIEGHVRGDAGLRRVFAAELVPSKATAPRNSAEREQRGEVDLEPTPPVDKTPISSEEMKGGGAAPAGHREATIPATSFKIILMFPLEIAAWNDLQLEGWREGRGGVVPLPKDGCLQGEGGGCLESGGRWAGQGAPSSGSSHHPTACGHSLLPHLLTRPGRSPCQGWYLISSGGCDITAFGGSWEGFPWNPLAGKRMQGELGFLAP